jgi:4-hydroxybenzoate polyprenyltransferase
MSRLKKILKSIWDEFIYGSHLISIAGASLGVIASDLLEIELNWIILVMFYLLLQFGFFYNRYKDFKNDFLTNPERTKHIEKYIKQLPIIIFIYALLFIIILFFYGNPASIILGVIMLIFSLLYSEIAKEFTKKIFLFKDIAFAGCWVLLVLLLALFFSKPFSLSVILLMLFVFIKIFLSTTLFDIKDTLSDGQQGIKTLPVLIGEEKVYKVLNVGAFIAFVPLGIGIYLRLFPFYVLGLLLTIPYTIFYLFESKKKKINPIILHYFLIGSEFNFYLVFLFLSKLFLCTN